MLRQFIWHLIAKLINPVYATRRLGVRVGEGCRICPASFGGEPWLVSIGHRVTVAPKVVFLTHDGATWLIRDDRGRRYRYGRIDIGNDVFVGYGAIIMPGVRIGNRVIVGAGSVVTRSVPDGCIVAGNPARVIARYSDYEHRALETFGVMDPQSKASFRAKINGIVEPDFLPPLPIPDTLSTTPARTAPPA